MMRLNAVKGAVADLRRRANGSDPAAWHHDEDALYRDVLIAIRDGAPNPASLAGEALKTQDIEGAVRWYE